MPIFEYKCAECGEKSEHLVYAHTEAPTCPNCQSDKLERIISKCGISVNGGGGSSGGGCGGCCGGR